MTDKFGFIAAECAAADDRALPTIARMCLLARGVQVGVLRVAAPAGSVPPSGAVSCSPTRSRHCSTRSAPPTATGASTPNSLRAGERVGPELVRKLMGEMDLIACATPAISYHHPA